MGFTMSNKMCTTCKTRKPTKGSTYKNYKFICEGCNKKGKTNESNNST